MLKAALPAAIAAALLATGCTPATPTPSTSPQASSTPTPAMAAAYLCRPATTSEEVLIARGGATLKGKAVAVDMEGGWRVVAFQQILDASDKVAHYNAIVTNGDRFTFIPHVGAWDGRFPEAGIVFAGGTQAQDTASKCLKG